MKLKWGIFLLCIPVFSQAQANRIDSLKQRLPFLQDSSRINCLNNISVEYYINALAETYINVQTDSAILYASKAYDEALKTGYTIGVADALQNLGEIARDRNEFTIAENYFQQSIPLFEKMHALQKYSWANLTLGWSLYKQYKFSAAKSVLERALHNYILLGNKERQSMLFRMISYTYSSRGYSEKAFEYMLKAIRITFDIKDPRGVVSSPENMARIYKDAGDTETALTYFQLAAQNAKSGNQPVRYNRLMGEISMMDNQFDSAILYYNESLNCVKVQTTDAVLIKKDRCIRSLDVAEAYLKQEKYDLAIAQLQIPSEFFESGHDVYFTMRSLYALARCYNLQKKFKRASAITKRVLAIAHQTGARPYTRDAYELYWQMYDQLGETDSAYKYSLKYMAIKDSILSDKYRRNIALSEMRSQEEQQKNKISLLQKDQQITKEKLSLQQQKIKSESLLRYILVAITLALLLVGVFIFRSINLQRKNEKQLLQHELEMQQLESKKKTIEFQQQATELEMQALRAQMNPHFIFNCLSSINRFILINSTEEASDYLTKFSRLIRITLHNSEKSYITLENELEALRLYLDLERLRFKNAFDYRVTLINTIDANSVFIPPMLIQPFAENAIWHGLMHKSGCGNLDISLKLEDKVLHCIIADNGIGRKQASLLKSRSAEKNKSMGLRITVERLAMLNQETDQSRCFGIEDVLDENGHIAGTKVIIKIRYRGLTEIVPSFA